MDGLRLGYIKVERSSCQDPPALLVAALTRTPNVERSTLLELYSKHVAWTVREVDTRNVA